MYMSRYGPLPADAAEASERSLLSSARSWCAWETVWTRASRGELATYYGAMPFVTD